MHSDQMNLNAHLEVCLFGLLYMIMYSDLPHHLLFIDLGEVLIGQPCLGLYHGLLLALLYLQVYSALLC